MKSILYIISLNVIFCLYNPTFAQNNFTIDNADYIFDINENTNFISASIINDGFVIRELQNDGSLIWTDTIFLTTNFPDKSIDWIQQFNNSNEFVMCSKNCKNLNYSVSQFDTCTYYFSKYNSITQSLDTEVTDTLYNEYFHPLTFKDTSILLFATDYIFVNMTFDNRRKTYSLNKEMEISFYAPSDSMKIYSLFGEVAILNDTIYRVEFVSSYLSVFKYSTSISLLNTTWATIPVSNNSYCYPFFTKIIGQDSILTLSHNSYNNELILTIYDFNSNLKKIVIINQPFESTSSGLRKTLYNEFQKLIYMTGENDAYILDLDLNIICTVPYNNSSLNRKLYEINDLTYQSNNGSDFVNLYCSTSITEELIPNLIDVFPNPFQEKLIINNPNSEQLEIKIYSSDLKIVYESFQKQSEINTSNLNEGVYFVSINDGKLITTKKLIKYK